MPAGDLRIDYAHVLTDAVGPVHGLTPAELLRAAEAVGGAIRAIEAERRDGKHRFRGLPGDKPMLAAVEHAARRHRTRWENLVVLGIGGSALGNLALQTALNPPFYNLMPAAKRRGPRLFVLDNVDPVVLANLFETLGTGLRKTLFNVISKSGETAETAAQFQIVRGMIQKKLGAKALAKHVLVTTDPESGTLREFASAVGCDTLDVPPGVGGRFSVLSAVGLFSAAMCGIPVRPLMDGAALMSKRVANPAALKNPAGLLALLLNAFYTRGKVMHVLFPYSSQLADFADWYRQLWAESLGKCTDVQGQPVVIGPTPITALGATDQHSQVQLYREGPNDKVFIFLEVVQFAGEVTIPRLKDTPASLRYLEGATLGELLNAEKRATEQALVASRRPCLTIRFARVDAHSVGQFIMLWEAATSIMGRLLNIDPYDQPAVQLGKDYTYALMGKKGYETQARELKRALSKRSRYVV